MKKFLLLSMAVLVVGAQLGKLTMRENDETQQKCGRKHERKVIHGDIAKKGEHPWAVSVYVRYINATTSKFSTLLGPGTLISSRHIIAFNTIKRSKSGTLNIIGMEDTGMQGTCEGDHMVLPREMLARYDVDVEHLKEFNGSRDFNDTVVKATVMYGCKSLTSANPMVLELADSMEQDTVPACVSNSEKNWNDVSGFSVYGMNKPGLLVSGRFAPVECSVNAPFSCAEAVNKANQGLCQGDFGGSAVARIDHRHTILGIYASGNTRCNANTEAMKPFHFVNLGYYRSEICDITGVCVPPPPSAETTPSGTDDHVTPMLIDVPNPFSDPLPHMTFMPMAVTEVAPLETTEEYEVTEIPEAPLSVEREEIYAETFEPMKIHVSNCTGGEVITAEKIEPMAVEGRGTVRGDRVRDINIHIHLNP